MNDFGPTQDHWQALALQWRGQAVDAIDVAALRNEVRRRGRYMGIYLAVEIMATLLVLAWLVWMFPALDSDRGSALLMVALGGVLVFWQGWSVWIRRRQLSGHGLDVGGMLELEIERARTSIRYWRGGMWYGMALWVLLVGSTVIGDRADGVLLGAISPGVIAVNAATMIGCGIFAWWLGRRNRNRIRILQGLQSQLER